MKIKKVFVGSSTGWDDFWVNSLGPFWCEFLPSRRLAGEGFSVWDSPKPETCHVILVVTPPRKINGWNLKITQLKKKIIFQTIIFRFHVHLPRCIGDFLEHPQGFFLTKKDLLVKTSLLVDTVINLLLKKVILWTKRPYWFPKRKCCVFNQSTFPERYPPEIADLLNDLWKPLGFPK